MPSRWRDARIGQGLHGDSYRKRSTGKILHDIFANSAIEFGWDFSIGFGTNPAESPKSFEEQMPLFYDALVCPKDDFKPNNYG